MQYIERALTRNYQLRQSLTPFIQCYSLQAEQLTTHRVRKLIINSPNYNLISFLQVLHTTHAPSNVPLDTSPYPASYSPQCLLTKSYQYISRILLLDTIHDSLGNPKPTVLVQGSKYSCATTSCPCPIIHSTSKHIPSIRELYFEL